MSYTHTDNVVYAYTAGDTQSAYVTVSPDATGHITILKEFTANSVTYTVTSIGAEAFNSNILSSVTFPSDSLINTIGKNAFKRTGIITINIPDSVTSIEDSAFDSNGIKTFTGGKNLTTIGEYAFYDNSITTLTIPNKVTTIKSYAFASNSLANVLFLGSDVTTIGDWSFSANPLTKLFIPVSVTSLGANAFRQNNELAEVYFLNNQTATTIGVNCFATTAANITAYYLEGFNSASLPSVFGTRKVLKTLVQILTPLVAQPGLSIETLVNDNYTFAQLGEASKVAVDSYMVDGYSIASKMFEYFSPTLVSPSLEWQSYLPYFTVSVIHAVRTSLTITDFKDAGANIQQVYNEFGLSAMIGAGYTVKQIIDGVAPDPSITAFKTANADKQQMLTQFGLQALWDSTRYNVADLKPYKVDITVDVTVTLAQWWALSPRPTVQQLYDGGYTSLQDLWDVIQNVSTIRTGLTPAPLLSAFWALSSDSTLHIVKPTVRQLNEGGYTVLQDFWNVIQDVATIQNTTTGLSTRPTVSAFNGLTNKPTISQLYNGGYDLVSLLPVYIVSDIKAAIPSLTITDFKTAGANIQQVYDKFALSAMIDALYTVSEIRAGVTTVNGFTIPPTISDFKAASANIQQVYEYFLLPAMINDAGYYVKDIVTGVTASSPFVYSDFASLRKITALSLMTYYLFSDRYSELLSQFTVYEIKTASTNTNVAEQNKNLSASVFKAKNAQIWQMLNAFTLAELTPLYPTTGELIVASNQKNNLDEYLVTITGNQSLTIDKIKAAGDELYQVMNYYSDLADLLQVGYRVAELVAESNKMTNGTRLVTVNDLQDLGNKLSSFVTANATVISRTSVSKLWDLVNYFELSDLLGYYNVEQLNATATNTDVIDSKKVTIARLKAAGANVQQVYDEFGLSNMIGALYTVQQVIDGVTPDPTISAFKIASADKQQMLTRFGLQALWNNDYQVAELKPYKVDINVDVTVTVAQWWALSPRPTVQQLYDGGYTVLQDLWDVIQDVSTIRSGLSPAPQLSAFWALSSDSTLHIVKPTVRQLNVGGYTVLQDFWNVIQDVATIQNTVTGLSTRPTVSNFDNLSNTSKPTIDQLYNGGYDLVSLLVVYTVSAIKEAISTLTITDFKAVQANVQQVFTKFGLSAMIGEGYTVSEICLGVTPEPSISDFKAASANIQQVFSQSQFGLDAMIGAEYYVKDIVAGVTIPRTLLYNDFASVSGIPAWNLMTYYLFSDRYSELLSKFTVDEIKTASKNANVAEQNKNLIASVFKNANAQIWQMLNAFLLPDLTPLYTTTELVDASNQKDNLNDYLVKLISGNQSLTIDKIKEAGDELYQVMNYYSLADLLQVDYPVSELVTESNSGRVTVTALQDLGNNLSSFVTANDTVIRRTNVSKLWNLVNYFELSDLLVHYNVQQLNATANDLRVDDLKKVTIARLKAADTNNLYVQDMLNEFGLQAMWNAGYLVSQLKVVKVKDFNYTVTVEQLWSLSSGSKPTVQDLYTNYNLQALWTGIYAVEPTTAVATIYGGLTSKPTVADFWALTSGKPTVQQLYAATYDNSSIYDLQALWNGIYSLEPTTAVATIYGGLTVNPTVAEFWALTSGKPTVQELKSSAKYNLQALWTGINNVATIHEGLTSKPTVAEFWALTNGKPSVQELKSSGKYDLQALWNGINDVATIHYGLTVKPTVAEFWALTSGKPTVQQLYAATYDNSSIYDLQDLWNGIYAVEPTTAVATIYGGLTVNPTVAEFWALTSGKPTVQELKSSAKYDLQALWTGIYAVEPTTAVATIHEGLTSKPTVAEFWALSSESRPTVQELKSSAKYNLQALWNGIQNVATISVGLTSMPTVADFWGLSSGSRPTIQQLYDATYDANSIYGLQDLWNGIYALETIIALRTIYDGLSVNPTADAFYALSPKPPVQQFYDVYGLSEVIRLGYTVQQVIDGVTPDPSISDFKAAEANVQQVYVYFGLPEMIGARYTVQQVIDGVTPDPSISAFKTAGANVQQVFTKFELSAMIGEGYTVSEICLGVTPEPSISDFKAASANIQQVFTKFGLDAMINEAGYYVADVITGVTSPSLVYSDFASAPVSTPLWNLMTHFDYDYNLLTQQWTVLQVYNTSSDSRVKSGNQNLTPQKFKDASAIIWQMLDTFQLADLIHLYTTTELVNASSNAGISNIVLNKNLTIDKIKAAEDELYQMMNYYSLADLLQVDYPVSELVAESNKMTNGTRLVTVNDLQDLGNKLSSFVTANATVISRTSVSKLWNLVNYFDLSALLGHYSVNQLNAIANDLRVIDTKKVTIARLKAAGANVQDMLTQFGLQAMWDAGYLVSQLKAVKVDGFNYTVTVAQLWSLSSDSTVHLAKPTVQDLYNNYGLQSLWTEIYSLEPTTAVATICDGLTVSQQPVKPTVSEFRALSSDSRPTIQELYDSQRYNLQDFWNAILDVTTIRAGLKAGDKPTSAQFRALPGDKPSVQQLYNVYGLADLINTLVPVQEILDGVIDPATLTKPSLSAFKEANARIWELLNTFTDYNVGFNMRAFIPAGYKVKDLVDALNEKDDSNNYRVAGEAVRLFDTETDANGFRTFGLGQFRNVYNYTEDPKGDENLLAENLLAENLLCNVLSSNYYNKIDKFIRQDDRHYTVQRLINASNATDNNSNYKVTIAANQQLHLKLDRFIDETKGGLIDASLASRILRYRSLFTNFDLKQFIDAYTKSYDTPNSFFAARQNGVKVVMNNANYDYNDKSGYWMKWDAANDWRVTVKQMKDANVSIYLMLNYYGNPDSTDVNGQLRNFQIMWDAKYDISAIRLACTETPETADYYKLLAEGGTLISVYSFLNWLSSSSRPTIRDLQTGGYGLQAITNGSADLSPLLATTTGYSPVPTVADFVALGTRPTIQRLYNAFGLQTLYNSIDTETGYVILYNIKTDVQVPVTDVATRQLTVADFWALSPRPTVNDLSQFASYNLQELWDGIGDVSDIYNGFNEINKIYMTVERFWRLSSSSRPTIQQLYDAKKNDVDQTRIFGLQELWTGIYAIPAERSTAVATIYNGLNLSTDQLIVRRPTVTDLWVNLDPNTRPTIQELKSSTIFGLQELWDAINAVFSDAVAIIYKGLTVKPTVAEWWALDIKSSFVFDNVKDGDAVDGDGNPVYKQERRDVGRPTIQQLIVANDGVNRLYDLQNLWDGIRSVAIIYDGYGHGSYPTIAQFNALSNDTLNHHPKPTLRNYLDRYTLLQIFSSDYSVAEILTAVSSGGDGAKTVTDIVNELKNAGCKINIPAPRITSVSFNDGTVTLRINQATPDIPITQYMYSHTSDGGVTWSDYAVVLNTITNKPLLPNNSGDLFITGFEAVNKLHSFRIRADAYDIISNTSNTFKNAFF